MNHPRQARVLAGPLFAVSISLVTAAVLFAVAPPTWWQTKHVAKVDALGNPVAANDYTALNQGQLKNMAIRAYEHLLENVPPSLEGIGNLDDPIVHPPAGGTGYRLRALVSQWVQIDTTTGRIKREELDTNGVGHGTYSINGTGSCLKAEGATGHNDYQVIKQGQLKAVALPFYDRLSELYRKPDGTSFFAGGSYPKPWTDTAADDQNYSAANLGHLKNVFNFDLRRDSDGDFISDIDELVFNSTESQVLDPFNGHSDGTNADGSIFFGNTDSDGDGVSDQDEVAAGTNPHIKDNPSLTLLVVGFATP